MGYDLLKSSFRVLMLFTPIDIKLEELTSAITTISEIKNAHHIHVWQLNESEIHLEAHLEFYKDISLSQFDEISDRVEELLLHEFGINHVNLQPEYQKNDPKDIIFHD